MRSLRFLFAPALALALVGAPVAPAVAATAPASILASQQVTPLAPGVSMTTFDRLYPGGWVRGYLLEVDLTQPGTYADLVTAPAVTAAQRLSEIAGRAGAIAAINGDFFDINNTKQPLGIEVQGGQVLKSAPDGWNAAGVGKDRLGQVMQAALVGTVNLPTGRHPLASMNKYTVPDGGIGLYTPLWTATRQGAAFGANRAREVIIRSGKVASVSTQITTGAIGPDTLVLVGREEGADRLAGLKVGDPVTVSYSVNPDLQFAVGGLAVMVKENKLEPLDDKKTGPRSGVGFSADGRRMLLLAVDGRSEESGGLTLYQFGALMQSLGAANALELDGGGSTTLVARTAPGGGLSVINAPSDGEERRIPNGVGIFAAPGSGKPTRLSLATLLGSGRTFPGLTRTLTVAAFDETHAPVAPGKVTWRAPQTITGMLTGDGAFVGILPGTAKVGAQAGQAVGEITMTVLGALERIEPDPTGLRLVPGRPGWFRIVGYDGQGYSAPIETPDVKLTYDQNWLKVLPQNDGYFSVTPIKEGSGLIEVDVQGKRTAVAVAAGTTTTAVDGFTGPWNFSKYPATVGGAITAVQGYKGKGIKLTYHFGAGSSNRAAYADPKAPVALPGAPERLGLWVKGDGKGAWLRAVVLDAKGRATTLDLARQVTWTGWRYVEIALPAGTASLSRIYPVETTASRQYSGELQFSDMQVISKVPLPAVTRTAPPQDPLLLAPGKSLKPGAAKVAIIADEASRKLATAAGAEVILNPRTVSDRLQSVDHNGTRFVLLNTGEGSLRIAGFQQLQDLKALLERTASDPAVKRVVMVGAHLPTQFTDPRERDLIQQWLGKNMTWIATGGTASAIRVEGIPYVQAGAALLLGITPDGLEAVQL